MTEHEIKSSRLSRQFSDLYDALKVMELESYEIWQFILGFKKKNWRKTKELVSTGNWCAPYREHAPSMLLWSMCSITWQNMMSWEQEYFSFFHASNKVRVVSYFGFV